MERLHADWIKQRPELAERFEVLSVIGDGTAGTVFKVIDRQRAHQILALKILKDPKAFDEHTLARFCDEIEISQSLDHPNLVRAYDFLNLGETIAYTMDFIDGEDLSAFVDRSGPVKRSEIPWYFSQILDALHELHSNEIVHRDLKLENVFIQVDGILKLGDLGLSKRLDRDNFTKTGLLLGTAQYMPPEYVHKGLLDERGDIFAAGVLLYEVALGKRYIEHLGGNQALEYVIKNRFRFPQEELNKLDPDLRAIVEKAAAYKAKDRYGSALEMKDDIMSLAQTRSSREPSVSRGNGALFLSDTASELRLDRERWKKGFALVLTSVASAVLAALAFSFL